MDTSLMLKFLEAIEVVKDVAEHGSPIRPVEGVPEGHECKSRVECALTGDPLVDAVLLSPTSKHNINNPVVDRTYDVGYGAGGSEPLEDPTTFIDRTAPATYTIGGVTYDPAEPWLIHENVEQPVMMYLISAGLDDETAYKIAHFEFAEKAENAWKRAHGIDVEAADAAEAGDLDRIQYKPVKRTPPNLYTKPYPIGEEITAADEPIREDRASPDDVKAAKEFLATVLGVELEKKEMDSPLDARVMAILQKDHPEAFAFFRTALDKTQPGAGDVHVPSASGQKKKKPSAAVGGGRKEDEEASVKKETVDFEANLKVTKVDDDQHIVMGWASVCEVGGKLVVDKQDDVILPEDIEKAAHEFALYCREQGDMHERVGVGKLIESLVFTKEKFEKCGLYAFDPETREQIYGWFVGFKVQDEGVWKRIKAGELPEFSIGGKAVRIPI